MNDVPADSPMLKPLPILPPINFDNKEEKLHIKYSITFFALHCVGKLVRVYMSYSYKRETADYTLNTGDRVVFEGIFVTSSIGTREIVLKMVEEQVENGGKCQTKHIHTEQYINL